MSFEQEAYAGSANALVKLLEHRLDEAVQHLKEEEDSLGELKERVKAQQEKVDEARRRVDLYRSVLEEESRRLGVSVTLPPSSEEQRPTDNSSKLMRAESSRRKRMPRGSSQRLAGIALQFLADGREHALSEIIAHVEKAFGQRIAPSTLRAALARSPEVEHPRAGYYQLSSRP